MHHTSITRNWTSENDIVHYQCVGIGVGPSNLSVTLLLHGYGDVSNIFFMLLNGSDKQKEVLFDVQLLNK